MSPHQASLLQSTHSPVPARTRLPWGPRVLALARWPVGGIRMHLLYNYPTLAEAGYRCTFVVPAGDMLQSLRDSLPAGPEFVGVPINGRRCPLWKEVRRQIQTGRFALLHAHGVTAAAHAALANLGIGLPSVVTLHEPLRADRFAGWLGPLKRWGLGLALARADAVVTVSSDSRANLLEYFPALGRRSDHVHTLHNGIRAQDYTDDEASDCGPDLRKEIGIPAGVPLVGFLGRFMPEKGFPLLLEAVTRLAAAGDAPPFHLVAFGSGDYRREYQRAITTAGLNTIVTLRDFVPDVRPVLRQLDLVVVPSLWEASSLISMEGMALGVPVLGSDCPGLREVLRGTPSRTVSVGDAGALAAGLSNALANLWTSDARAHAPAARARFDNAPSARGLARLFDRLLAREEA